MSSKLLEVKKVKEDLEKLMESLLDNGFSREEAIQHIKRHYGWQAKEDNPLARE